MVVYFQTTLYLKLITKLESVPFLKLEQFEKLRITTLTITKPGENIDPFILTIC